jgi:DNA-binding MarR family transcriptional regulator
MTKRESKATEAVDRIEALASDLVRRLDLLMGGRAGDAISRPQYILLSALQKQGTVSLGVLCGVVGAAQSTTSELVARMEKAGLVRKSRSLQDARVAWIAITDQGRSMLLQYRQRPREAFRRLFAEAGAEARGAFLASLENLLGILDRGTSTANTTAKRRGRAVTITPDEASR